MESDSLGRLIHTLPRKCQFCGHSLQLRERKISELLRGETIEKPEEYICCSVCDFTEEIRNPKKRKERFDKTKFVKEPEEKRRYNASDKFRPRPRKDVVAVSRGNNRGNSR